MTEQRKRLQEINARLALLGDNTRHLREELAYNDKVTKGLLEERSQLIEGGYKQVKESDNA
jgi:hypothetical protein